VMARGFFRPSPGLAAAVLGSCVASSTAARADESKLECVAAHEQAQAERREGHLRAARKHLIVCARDACPALVRQDCGPWLGQVTEEQPTVVFAVRDAAGADATAVQVVVDGEVVAEHLDGLPIDLDPGAHRIRFVLPDGRTLEQPTMVRAGEKGREIRVAFGPAAPSSAPPAAIALEPGPSTSGSGSPRLTAPALVAGTAGLVALGSWGYFGLSGHARQTDLQGSCAPNCPPSAIDDVRHRYLAADISLGVGVVSLGLAAYFVLTAGSPPAARDALRWSVSPLPGGGATTVGGDF